MQEAHAHRVALVLTEAVSCWCDSALGVVPVDRARVVIHGSLRSTSAMHVRHVPAYADGSRECRCTRSIAGLSLRLRGVPLRRPLDTLADQPDDEFQLGFVTGLYTMILLPQSPYWCGSAQPRSQSSAARFDGRQRWMLVSSIPCRCAGAIGFRCSASDVSAARTCAAPVAPQRGRRPLGELRMRPLRGCHGTRAAAKSVPGAETPRPIT